METKICTKCSVEYPATKEFFLMDTHMKSYFISKCKHCTNKRRRDRYKENQEKERALTQKWKHDNIEKARYNSTKDKLKRKIGETPPPELVEVKVLINKTKQLCKTLKS
jgi:hypothetical protein